MSKVTSSGVHVSASVVMLVGTYDVYLHMPVICTGRKCVDHESSLLMSCWFKPPFQWKHLGSLKQIREFSNPLLNTSEYECRNNVNIKFLIFVRVHSCWTLWKLDSKSRKNSLSRFATTFPMYIKHKWHPNEKQSLKAVKKLVETIFSMQRRIH